MMGSLKVRLKSGHAAEWLLIAVDGAERGNKARHLMKEWDVDAFDRGQPDEILA